MKSKKINFIIIILLILILLIRLSSRANNYKIIEVNFSDITEEGNKGILEVIERLSAEKVLVQLNDKYSHEFILYSSTLKKDDKINVKYLLNDNIINFQRIENYNSTKEEQLNIYNLTKNDNEIKKYQDKLSFTFDFDTDFSYNNYLLEEIILVRIGNQNYLSMNSIDYLISTFDCDCLYLSWEKAKTITINIGYDYEVLNFIFIPSANDYNMENMKQVNYVIKDKKLDFERINNHGMYELTIKYQNEDIIKIIFQ